MSRRVPPSFDFFVDDFVSGTQDMHPLARGMYISLLCYQWSRGSIPNPENIRQIVQITGAMPDEVAAHLPELLGKFEKQADGSYVNARLLREFQRKISICGKRREAGAASKFGRSSAHANAVAIADANAQAKESAFAHANLEVGSRKKEVGSTDGGSLEAGSLKKRKRKVSETVGEWVLPDGWDLPRVRELLAEFEAMRIRKGSQIENRSATSRYFKRFDDVEHLCYALEVCIAEGWIGLKPDYRPVGRSSSSQLKTFAQQRVENTKRVIEEFANG